MLTIRHKTNPFGKAEVKQVPFQEQSLRAYLEPYLAGKEFAYPTFVKVNGTPWLREQWDDQVSDSSKIEIIAVVGEVITIITLVTLVASLAFSVYGIYKARKAMRALRAGMGKAESDPFFSVDGHGNKANLNNPIEVAYGKNRMWPSYIGRPYRTYRDDRLSAFISETSQIKNTNFVQIFCLGQGVFDIHAVQVGEVLLESYRGMRYEIVNPGEQSTELARVMYVQPDFEEVLLAVGSSTDVFTMSPPGSFSNHFEIDVEVPADGEYQVEVTQTALDENGAFTYEVYRLYLDRPKLSSSAESQSPPHRNTFVFLNGPAKRYAFQIKNMPGSQPVSILELRSYLDPSIPLAYSDKTLLIVNYFVTTLSDELVKDKINVLATRKLNTRQVLNGALTSIIQPTRSIPWAIYDVLTNGVYGGGLSEDFIDLEAFSELHGDLERDDIFFDYVFNQSSTVSDAVKVIAAAGRCSLGYNGSRLTLIRDNGNSTPEALFSSENILPGSLSWSTELFDPTEPDAIEGSYVDINSGEERTTLFIPEGSHYNNVQKVSLQGVGALRQAWRECCHKMQKLRLIRDSFKFKTGMEGYVPSLGATAYLSWDMDGMGIGGYVEDYVSGWVYLSRAITPSPSGMLGKIIFRRDDGSAMGPYVVTAVASEDLPGTYKAVQIGSVDFGMPFFRTDKEPVHFVFNQGDFSVPVATKIQIENISPSDDGTIEVTATNYNPEVYAFDSMEPPLDEYAPVVPSGSPPPVPWVRATAVEQPTASGLPYTALRWGSSFGATSYRVYVGSAATLLWEGVDTYLEIPLAIGGDQPILVCGVRAGSESPLLITHLTVGVSNPNVYIESTYFELESDGIKVWWDDCPIAISYEVSTAYLLDGVLSAYSPWYSAQTTEFKYTKAMFKQDFGNVVVTGTTMIVSLRIRVVLETGPSLNSVGLAVAIPRAPSPTSVSIEQDPKIVTGLNFTRHRTVTWQSGSDIVGSTYHVYMEGYSTEGGSSVLDVKPWVRVATTDKFAISTDVAISFVKNLNAIITDISEEFYYVYGKGCDVDLVQNITMQIGEVAENCLYVFNPSTPNEGKFHTVISRKVSVLFGGRVWIANVTPSYLAGKYATLVQKVHRFDSPYGRVKGAIVADNGWFASIPPNSTTTFDVEL